MTLAQILDELLGQHASLRSLAAEVRELAGLPASASTSAELARRLRALGDAVDAHSAREEELLGGVLQGLDAWGPARAAKMDDHHREEHRHLREALGAAARIGEFAGAVRAALPAIDELLEHMREEEAEHLNADVLRDDGIVVDDQFDG